MTVCTLIYDASTGSNTAASGSNAPTTAVTGTNANITTTTVTLNETVDFTGVADDDTDVLWIDTPSGDRHLYRITAFNPNVGAATTLTVTPSAGTARTGDSWAVGGIRQDFDNDGTQLDFADMLAGWDFSLQDTATFVLGTLITPITLPAVGDVTDGPARILAAAGDSPAITWSDTGTCFTVPTSSHFEFHNLSITNASVTGAAQYPIDVTGDALNVRILGCTFSAGGGLHISNGGHVEIIDCDITALYSTTATGIDVTGGRPKVYIRGCSVHGCTLYGISHASNTSFCDMTIVSTVVRDCTSAGIHIVGNTGSLGCYMQNLVLHDNGGDGIEIVNTMTIGAGKFPIVNSIFTNNGGYGIDVTSAGAAAGSMMVYEDYNAFGTGTFANTSGQVNGVTQGANDVTLTSNVSPYTDHTTDDYSLNSTAGGGAACADAGTGRTT